MPTVARNTHPATRKSTTPRKAASKSPDAIQLLKSDHAEVSGMFDKYENGRLTASGKQKLAQKICTALTIHAQIEEEIFYPAARKVATKETDPMLDEAEVEHGSVKELIADIEGGSREEDDLFDARVKVLGEYVKHHVKEEEGELFPKIKKTKLDLEEVGARLAARKEELAEEMNA
jgi:hemerythrin superfamily protein